MRPGAPDGGCDVWIVGLGIQNADHVTRETERVLRAVREVLYVDTGVATREFLATLCPVVTPLFESSYAAAENRLSAYHRMAARVLEAALDHAPVAFAMQGHPLVGAYAPALIHDAAGLLGLRVRALPGISSLDCLFAELMLDPCVHGLQMFEATDLLLRRRPLSPDVPALLWQIGNLETRLHSMRPSRPARFDRFRAHLERFYPADHLVTAVYASPHPLMRSTHVRFPLAEIGAHARELHAGFTLYVPPTQTRPVADAALLSQIDSPEHLRSITEGP